MSVHTQVGVISDTHGLLRPEAEAALAGVDGIVHAGDVHRSGILERLATIAPLLGAVRGNVDRGSWAEALPHDQVVDVGGQLLYVVHDLEDLTLDPGAAGFAAVIYGHSHRPSIDWRDGVLFLNPGSAGPRRFDLPVTLARLEVSTAGIDAEVVDLLDA